MPLLWLLLAVGLTIAEVFTSTFVLIMFAGGALAAAGAAALDAGVPAQLVVFAVVSTLALFGLRPVIRRHLDRGGSDTPLGLAAIEGGQGLVLEKVDAHNGSIKIEGEVWSARVYDSTQVIEAGERVRVIEIKGAIAMVWRE